MFDGRLSWGRPIAIFAIIDLYHENRTLHTSLSLAQLPRDLEVVEEVARDGVRRPASPDPR